MHGWNLLLDRVTPAGALNLPLMGSRGAVREEQGVESPLVVASIATGRPGCMAFL